MQPLPPLLGQSHQRGTVKLQHLTFDCCNVQKTMGYVQANKLKQDLPRDSKYGFVLTNLLRLNASAQMRRFVQNKFAINHIFERMCQSAAKGCFYTVQLLQTFPFFI